MNEFLQKRRELLEEISESLNIPLIEKLPTDQVDNLSSQIKEQILNHKNYKGSKNLDTFLEKVFERMTKILYVFPVLGEVSSVDIYINPELYDKLNNVVPFDILEPEVEDHGTDTKNQSCQDSLAKYITITIHDLVDINAAQFDNLPEAHFPLMFDNVDVADLPLMFDGVNNNNSPLEHKYKSKQIIIDEIITDYSRIYSSTFVKNNLNLIKTHAYCKKIIPNFNNVINTICKIENNLPQINQFILNSTYDVIIEKLNKLIEDRLEFNKIRTNIIGEKQMNATLFTDHKRFAHLKLRNHYMSFLYKCTVGADTMGAKNIRLIFAELADSLIQGHLQIYEHSRLSENAKKIQIKELKVELQTLSKYNSNGENSDNIKKLEEKISFFSQKKTSLKLLPYKLLAERLSIDQKELTNLIKNTISINKTNLSDKVDKSVIQTPTQNINTTLNFIK